MDNAEDLDIVISKYSDNYYMTSGSFTGGII